MQTSGHTHTMRDSFRIGIIGASTAYASAAVSTLDLVEAWLRIIALLFGIGVSAWSMYRLWKNK
jgi:aspartate aminotransferase-like enzyme